MISALRLATITALVTLAVIVQVTMFADLMIGGVTPDVALLVVIAAAFVRGPEYGALVGFGAGLLLDLAPPADHTAGRWALAYVLVGYLCGLVRHDARASAVAAVIVVAAGSFVATSVFALTGLVLGDGRISIGAVIDVVPLAVLYDVLLTPFVVPAVVALLSRLEPTPAWGMRGAR